MKATLFVAFLALTVAVMDQASADNGIRTKSSPHSVEETVKRFEEAAEKRGMKVFPRFDHGAAAKSRGKEMAPAIVVSVGNPKYGTPFMVKNPVAAIDFPPKAVVYEDGAGKVWISYNTAEYLYGVIFKRHGLSHPEGDVAFYARVLEELTDYAVAPPS